MKQIVGLIGGGIIGTSIAYQLAQAGDCRVLLWESGQIGSGSTAKSVGGVRAVFGHRLEIELSKFSLDAFRRLQATAPEPIGFNRQGYLLLVRTPERDKTLKESAELSTQLGIAVEEVHEAQLAQLVPSLNITDIRRAVLAPDDGFLLDPSAVARTYANLAVCGGAEVYENAPVTRITRQGEGFEIRAFGQTWRVDQLVVATNAFTGNIIHHFGITLACYPYPRHVFRIEPVPTDMNPHMPITVFQDDDIFIRHEGSHITSICGLQEKSTFNTEFSAERLQTVEERIAVRLPKSKGRVSHAWTGLRAVTPDRRAIVGSVPTVPGVVFAIGFSGHGVMHAPAIGVAVAELVRSGRSTSFNLEPLSPVRFLNPATPPPILEPVHQ
jgi:sarcosine oxidase subunit beta